jgi:predicted nucleic acid-binding protein
LALWGFNLILVADSSFLYSLIEGDAKATEYWGKAKAEGSRIFVPTTSITFFVSKCFREGRGEYIDLMLAVLRQTLNVSVIVCDVGVAIDAGRILNNLDVGVEEAFVLAVAGLKKAEGVLTLLKDNYAKAIQEGLINKLP